MLNTFTVLWDSVTSDPVCGPVEYDVTISSSGGVKLMRVANTSYNFTGLTPFTYYIITVAAVNKAGVGQASAIVVNTPTMSEALPSGTYVSTVVYLINILKIIISFCLTMISNTHKLTF